EVILQSASLDAVGFVRDYGELSALNEFLDTTVDHRHLNDVLGHDDTTAEVISKWLYDWCKSRWPEVVAVRVAETPSTWAEFQPCRSCCAPGRSLCPRDRAKVLSLDAPRYSCAQPVPASAGLGPIPFMRCCPNMATSGC